MCINDTITSSEAVLKMTLFTRTFQPPLPLHWTPDGLPVGVQLVAAYGREDLLVRVASQLEDAMPWKDRIPPVHA